MSPEIPENRVLHVYGAEIISYEESVSEAFSSIRRFCKYQNPASGRIHEALRHLLADSALISLIFFPMNTKSQISKLRAKFLCEKFQVKDNSYLKSRALRNHLSHLDERLDNWVFESKMQTFGRAMLGSRADAVRHGLNHEDILGIFDPQTLIFSFLEDDLRVDELVAEIRRISQASRSILRDLHWVKEIKNVH